MKKINIKLMLTDKTALAITKYADRWGMTPGDYDNLERLAKRRSVDDLTERVQFYADRLNDELFQEKYSRANLIEYMAELYNALDLLCIHFDCADRVQDMAEDLCSVQAQR